jgi:hypothetical protein
MKTLLSGLMAAGLAASLVVSVPAPANAAPVFVPQAEQGRTDVQQVAHTIVIGSGSSAARSAALTGGTHGSSATTTASATAAGTTARYYGRSYGFAPRYYPRYYRSPGISLRFDL